MAHWSSQENPSIFLENAGKHTVAGHFFCTNEDVSLNLVNKTEMLIILDTWCLTVPKKPQKKEKVYMSVNNKWSCIISSKEILKSRLHNTKHVFNYSSKSIASRVPIEYRNQCQALCFLLRITNLAGRCTWLWQYKCISPWLLCSETTLCWLLLCWYMAAHHSCDQNLTWFLSHQKEVMLVNVKVPVPVNYCCD